jgi:hypothetical protein
MTRCCACIRVKAAGVEKCDHLAKFGFAIQVYRRYNDDSLDHHHHHQQQQQQQQHSPPPQDLVDAGFTDAFAYAIQHKIDARSAAFAFVLDRNNMCALNPKHQIFFIRILTRFSYNAASGGDVVRAD